MLAEPMLAEPGRTPLRPGHRRIARHRRIALHRRLVLAMSLAALLWPATSARADEPASPHTTYRFEDDLVKGDFFRPMGERLRSRLRSTRTSLIRSREHFVPEMLESVEDL